MLSEKSFLWQLGRGLIAFICALAPASPGPKFTHFSSLFIILQCSLGTGHGGYKGTCTVFAGTEYYWLDCSHLHSCRMEPLYEETTVQVILSKPDPNTPRKRSATIAWGGGLQCWPLAAPGLRFWLGEVFWKYLNWPQFPHVRLDCACAPCCGLFVVAAVANAASDCCECQRKKRKKSHCLCQQKKPSSVSPRVDSQAS